MPVQFGTLVVSASYDKDTRVLTVVGEAFGINQYAGISNIEVSPSGAGVWAAVSTIVSWADELVVGLFATDLAVGTYDVRVTSSDGEISPISTGAFVVHEAFVVPGAAKILFFFQRSK